MPTLPLSTIRPFAAPPVLSIKPPLFPCPVALTFKGTSTLPPVGETLGSCQAAKRTTAGTAIAKKPTIFQNFFPFFRLYRCRSVLFRNRQGSQNFFFRCRLNPRLGNIFARVRFRKFYGACCRLWRGQTFQNFFSGQNFYWLFFFLF